MRRAQRRKYHFIYKTTCLTTNRYYIGMHSTDNLDDGYLGSGKILWFSINKHGRESHICEKIEFLNDRESLRNREKEIVNESILKDPLCMNLNTGGDGSWSVANNNSDIQRQKAIKANKKMKWLWENDECWKNKLSIKRSNYMINSYKNGTRIPNPPDWTGKKHSEETKEKMRSYKGKQQGNKNSQFGTSWITNGKENKKNKKNSGIPNGWYLGRINVKNC